MEVGTSPSEARMLCVEWRKLVGVEGGSGERRGAQRPALTTHVLERNALLARGSNNTP